MKNTVFLFFRSVAAILIGLYASRVLLGKLGVEDYGVYNIVGGVVMLFGSLKTMFTNAIQRFLNYSKGEEDAEKQNRVFNTGIRVQLMLAASFILLTETAGLYAFFHLNLTEEQFSSAGIVYQLTIASTVVSILTVPYHALLLANERMDAYAWFAIAEQLLHLLVIFLIGAGPFSRLINYAILLLVVSCFMQALMILYCRRHFPEAKLRRMGDRKLLSEMLRFAGWNFLGCTGLNITHQGVNYILNLTGGVVVNAARSITYQVMSGANTLVGNTNMAFKPQTNAAVAQKDKQAFHKLLAYNGKTAFVCYLLVVVPILVFAKPLVQLWLGQVPEYVIPFLLAISVYYLLRSLHELVNQFFISIGEMKEYQLIEFCTMILIIPLAWLLLKKGFPYWSVFLGMALVEVLNHVGTVWLAVKKYGFPIRYFASSVYLPFVLMAILSFGFVVIAYRTGIAEAKSVPILLLQGAGLEVLLAATTLAVALDREERKQLLNVVKTWIRANNG